jgi:hypothetical protein
VILVYYKLLVWYLTLLKPYTLLLGVVSCEAIKNQERKTTKKSLREDGTQLDADIVSGTKSR